MTLQELYAARASVGHDTDAVELHLHRAANYAEQMARAAEAAGQHERARHIRATMRFYHLQ